MQRVWPCIGAQGTAAALQKRSLSPHASLAIGRGSGDRCTELQNKTGAVMHRCRESRWGPLGCRGDSCSHSLEETGLAQRGQIATVNEQSQGPSQRKMLQSHLIPRGLAEILAHWGQILSTLPHNMCGQQGRDREALVCRVSRRTFRRNKINLESVFLINLPFPFCKRLWGPG